MTNTARQRVEDSYEQQGIDPPRNPETGEILLHTEWNGWLFCEVEGEAFDWQTGDVTCPHCGREFHVRKPTTEVN